ncbi:M4 family metallopeptidase, partial [Verrucomicrobium sp. BvORR034]|uniref:M4 family metallopeptidase n=1 Tax=Verrucomicrobium sp. BvORR034 TaxID=1396418 RepID=UPI002240EF2C
NSGIHNRAFYNVMQSKDGGGSFLFTPTEAAVLYYVTLTRLAPSSTFSDCRRTLLNVTTQRYQGQPTVQQDKLNAIKAAYTAVGIL